MRSVQNCKFAKTKIRVKSIVPAGPRWWFLPRTNSSTVASFDDDVIHVPIERDHRGDMRAEEEEKQSAATGDRNITDVSAGIAVVAWHDVSESVRRAATYDAMPNVLAEASKQKSDCESDPPASRKHRGNKGEEDMMGEVVPDSEEEEDTKGAAIDSANAARNLEVDEENVEEASEGLMEKRHHDARVTAMGGSEGVKYICVDGRSVLQRLRAEEDETDVSVLSAEGGPFQADEIIFIASGLAAVKACQTPPGITNFLDHAARVTKSVLHVVGKPLGARVRGQEMPVALRPRVSEHIKKAHELLLNIVLESATFKALVGDDNAGEKLHKNALAGKEIFQTLPRDIKMQSGDGKAYSESLRQMEDHLQRHSGMGARRAIRAPPAARNVKNEAESYLHALQSLHGMPVTQCILRLLDMRYPGTLDENVVSKRIGVIRKCHSDAGAALFLLWIHKIHQEGYATVLASKAALMSAMMHHDTMLGLWEKEARFNPPVLMRLRLLVPDVAEDWMRSLCIRISSPELNRIPEMSQAFEKVIPAHSAGAITSAIGRGKSKMSTKKSRTTRASSQKDNQPSDKITNPPKMAKGTQPSNKSGLAADTKTSKAETKAASEANAPGLIKPGPVGKSLFASDAASLPEGGSKERAAVPENDVPNEDGVDKEAAVSNKRGLAADTKASHAEIKASSSEANDPGLIKPGPVGKSLFASDAASLPEGGALEKAAVPENDVPNEDGVDKEAAGKKRDEEVMTDEKNSKPLMAKAEEKKASTRAPIALLLGKSKFVDKLSRAYATGQQDGCYAIAEVAESCGKTVTTFGRRAVNYGSEVFPRLGMRPSLINSLQHCFEDAVALGMLCSIAFGVLRIAHGQCTMCCEKNEACKASRPTPCTCNPCLTALLKSEYGFIVYGEGGSPYADGLSLPRFVHVTLRMDGVYVVESTDEMRRKLLDAPSNKPRMLKVSEKCVLSRVSHTFEDFNQEASEEMIMDARKKLRGTAHKTSGWVLETTQEYLEMLSELQRDSSLLEAVELALGYADVAVSLAASEGICSVNDMDPGRRQLKDHSVQVRRVSLQLTLPGAQGMCNEWCDREDPLVSQEDFPFIAVLPYPFTQKSVSSGCSASRRTQTAAQELWSLEFRTVPRPLNIAKNFARNLGEDGQDTGPLFSDTERSREDVVSSSKVIALTSGSVILQRTLNSFVFPEGVPMDSWDRKMQNYMSNKRNTQGVGLPSVRWEQCHHALKQLVLPTVIFAIKKRGHSKYEPSF